MKPIAIVIPVYDERICENDAVSLGTFKKHFSRHDVIFACPEGMDVSAYFQYFPRAVCRRFAMCHFRSVRAYSKLLEQQFFYSSFLDYEYILICQLDCFVFKDELDYWCQKGFSYIGAPWADCNFIGGWKRSLFRFLPFKEFVFPSVGNGGFSLRNVSIHARWQKNTTGFL